MGQRSVNGPPYTEMPRPSGLYVLRTPRGSHRSRALWLVNRRRRGAYYGKDPGVFAIACFNGPHQHKVIVSIIDCLGSLDEMLAESDETPVIKECPATGKSPHELCTVQSILVGSVCIVPPNLL